MTETDVQKPLATSSIWWIAAGVPVLVISIATIGGSIFLAPYKGVVIGLVIMGVVAPVTSYGLAKRLAQQDQDPDVNSRSVLLRPGLLAIAQWLFALVVGSMEGCVVVLATV